MERNELIIKIIRQLPMPSCRSIMTDEEWYSWFEEVFEKGYSQGYDDASKEATEEIHENYRPDNN